MISVEAPTNTRSRHKIVQSLQVVLTEAELPGHGRRRAQVQQRAGLNA